MPDCIGFVECRRFETEVATFSSIIAIKQMQKGEVTIQEVDGNKAAHIEAFKVKMLLLK